MLNSSMRIVRAFTLFFALAALPASTGPAFASEQPLVVVELFTSQGCSSCPPADAYLGELAQRPDVLALSHHVDYWNYIGWTDPYASKAATQRQRDYAKQLNLRYVYTPQMVINGTTEGVGSERSTIASLIKAAEEEKAPRPAIAITRESDGKLAIHIGAGIAKQPAAIVLMGFDQEHSTHVLRGENEGQTLREYRIVRSCETIGTWNGAALDLAVPADKVGGDGGVAVLLQQGGGTGRVVGAALLKPPTS
jgi:hypothetical protein